MSKLNNAEAIYGFAAWLTSRDEPVHLSSHHNAARIVELINKFLGLNNMSPPRDGYEKNLRFPKEK